LGMAVSQDKGQPTKPPAFTPTIQSITTGMDRMGHSG
jgi:hypothetical protein